MALTIALHEGRKGQDGVLEGNKAAHRGAQRRKKSGRGLLRHCIYTIE